jgi:hypothetical protein
MNSSRKTEDHIVKGREPLLVAEAGAPYAAAPADPVAAWLDLMDVVEALAPRQQASASARLVECGL